MFEVVLPLLDSLDLTGLLALSTSGYYSISSNLTVVSSSSTSKAASFLLPLPVRAVAVVVWVLILLLLLLYDAGTIPSLKYLLYSSSFFFGNSLRFLQSNSVQSI